jgi:hypothetical protein
VSASIWPPPRAQSARARDVARVVDSLEQARARRAAPRRARSRPARARDGLDRDDPLAHARGARRCRAERGRMLKKDRTPSLYGTPRMAAPPIDAELAVVGAGAAGLYVALCAARAGARRDADLGDAARPDRELLGAGRPRRRARGPTTAPSSTCATPSSPGAGWCATRRPRALQRGSRARARPRAARRRFDADRHGRLALGLEGGHSVRRIVHAGGSATGRRVVRQLSALAAQEPRIEVLDTPRAVALLLTTDAASACAATTADRSARGGRDLRPAGAAALWSRTTNPPGRSAAACCSPRRRRRARRPRVHAVSPDGGRRRRNGATGSS